MPVTGVDDMIRLLDYTWIGKAIVIEVLRLGRLRSLLGGNISPLVGAQFTRRQLMLKQIYNRG
jgi:hypothetical protein